MPAHVKPFLAALVEWTVILVTALTAYYSVPLLFSNLEETTIVLGIGYAWLTLPITIGCVLFVAHAAVRLFRLPLAAVVSMFLIPAVAVALFLIGEDALGANLPASMPYLPACSWCN